MKKFISYIFILTIVFIFTACSSSIADYSKSNDYRGVIEASKVEYIDKKDARGHTALHNACDNGNLNIVKYVIQKGANIEARTSYGDTPLIRAAYKGHLDVVKYLVQKGANLNAQSNSGVTALITASGWGRYEIVKYLVDSGANIKFVTKSNKTALKTAIKYKKTRVVNFFNKILEDKVATEKKEKEKKLVEEKQKKEAEQIALVNKLISDNNFEGLKKYTDKNPNAVYFIEDPMLRLMLTGPKGLKVGDIRKLVKKGRSEKIIISLINRVKTPYKEFDLKEIDILVEMGLSDNIIASMIDITTQLLKDEQRRKEQEYYLNEQMKISKQNSKTQIVRERVVEKQAPTTKQNSAENELMNAIGKEVGQEIGKKLLDQLF